jgi:hypothetical protein
MKNDTARAKLGIDMTIVGNGKVNSSPQQDSGIVAKVRVTAMEALDVYFGVPLIDWVCEVRVVLDTLVAQVFSHLNFSVQDEFAAVEVLELFGYYIRIGL